MLQKCFWYPSPDLCNDTILCWSPMDNCLDLMVWFLLRHALSTVGSYINRCVPFQIMSNGVLNWFPIRNSCLSLSLIGDPILVAIFPCWFCGLLSMCSCLSSLVLDSGTFVLFHGFSFIKRRMYAYHAAPWSHPYDET